MRIAVSGSRKGIDRKKVEEVLSWYCTQGHHWVLGGAMGVDQYALDYLLSQGESLEVIVPFTIEDTPVTDGVKDCLRTIPEKVTELKQEKTKPIGPKFHNRNSAMISRADMLLAFPVGTTGGTRNAMWQAEKQGKEVREF